MTDPRFQFSLDDGLVWTDFNPKDDLNVHPGVQYRIRTMFESHHWVDLGRYEGPAKPGDNISTYYSTDGCRTWTYLLPGTGQYWVLDLGLEGFPVTGPFRAEKPSVKPDAVQELLSEQGLVTPKTFKPGDVVVLKSGGPLPVGVAVSPVQQHCRCRNHPCSCPPST